jgi:hypothetical protein
MADNTPPVLIVEGTIIEIASGLRFYLVRTYLGSVRCSAVSEGSVRLAAPKNFGIYSVGDVVLVVVRTVNNSGNRPVLKEPGYILGTIPTPVLTGKRRYRPCDSIYQMPGMDGINDGVHRYLLEGHSKELFDFNMAQPVDAIPGSDLGKINELGLGFGLSRMMAWMRASDVAGVWFFYQDHLMRQAAYNYEFWTSGGERWIKNDEGEVNDVDMFTPYPWEAMGLTVPGGPVNTAAVGQDAIPTFPKASKDGGRYTSGNDKLLAEPTYEDQAMLPRFMCLRGYLGDMQREMVIMPFDFAEVDRSFIERSSNDTKYTGLLDIQKHTDGMLTVRSAKGIILQKRLLIPVPKQKAPPEQSDSLGDGSTNYHAAGVFGPTNTEEEQAKLEAHTKTEWPWSSTDRADIHLAEMFDYHTHLFNWYGVKTLLNHNKDWFLPEEEDFAGKSDVGETYIPEVDLFSEFALPMPTPIETYVDHRTKSKFYKSLSTIAQLADGSILIEDGYGSNIMFSGGNIILSAPGDIIMKPGRSLITWAPDDIIQRAGSSIDITASKGDIRLKAENNLHMLGGNSGLRGGVIIEARAPYVYGGDFQFDHGEGITGEDVVSYGIILKSTTATGKPAGPIMVYGSDIYLRSVSDSGSPQNLNGQVVIDADGIMALTSKEHYTLSKGGVSHVLGKELRDFGGAWPTPGTDYVINYFDKTMASIGTSSIDFKFRCGPMVFYNGDALFSGRLGTKLGMISVPGPVIDDLINTVTASYNAMIAGDVKDDIQIVYNETYNDSIRGVTDFIEVAGFSCRNKEQYGLITNTVDFKFAETRWQQLYRKNDRDILWVEPEVLVPGEHSSPGMPHPGKELWDTNTAMALYDDELWDWETNRPFPRDKEVSDGDTERSVYADPKPEDRITLVKLSEGYQITRQIGATPPDNSSSS